MERRLRIAQVTPPLERVPPRAYGGTERIVHELATQLGLRGHEVTTYASGDSDVPGRLVPTLPVALRPAGYGGDASGFFLTTVAMVLDDARRFDVIHSHLEWFSGLLARAAPVPVVSTFHGRLDLPWASGILREPRLHRVAISRDQARVHPDLEWHVIHNGLTLDGMPFERRRGEDYCFVGRVAPEKGIIEAIEIARGTGRRIRIAAKIGTQPEERAFHDEVFLPAIKAAGSIVEFVGEIEGAERDRLFAESYATLMPGAWPEPFGLVAIESLACGTPILARRHGALPEIVREGIDGVFGDDVSQLVFQSERLETLDRVEIRRSALERFSASRMTDGYVELFNTILTAPERADDAAKPSAEPIDVGRPRAGTATGRTGARVSDLHLPDAGGRIVRPTVRPSTPSRVGSRTVGSSENT
jgi:glycosyltransferase involved in cell wall biosynthesis